MSAPLDGRVPGHASSIDLLILMHPLLRFVRGEKRASLKEAWTRAAMTLAAHHLGADEEALPRAPHAAILALHAAVLELGESQNMSRQEFVEAFNDRGEAGLRGVPGDAGAAIEKCGALLALFCARRMESVA